MHAIVVREMVAADRIEESKAPLENVVPRAKQSPGAVAGFWTVNEDGRTLNLLVYDSEEAARAAMDRDPGRTEARVRAPGERGAHRGARELLAILTPDQAALVGASAAC